MYIHNFYSDLLLSVRVLFDNYIFHSSDYIKKYEFNYGNRTFQLDENYKQNYEFPVILVNLNNPTPTFGQRTEVINPTPTPSINHIPVLYNKTNNNTLYIQEEQTNVGLSITINCESQFQAREIEHVILRYLPLNKYINLFSFTSFLEVDDLFLQQNLFDPNNHDIINLYDKLNNNTGKINHFFSLLYEPLIRNESLTTSISDSNQRSFQVTLELTYSLQLPIFLFSNNYSKFTSININYGNFGLESISDYPVQRLISDLNTNTKTVKHQLLYSDINEISEESNNLVRITLQPDPKSIILYDYFTYNFVCNNKIYSDMNNQFFGNENKVVFEFSKEYFNNFLHFDLCKPLIIQIVEPYSTKEMCS